jgi:hypothetical protein
MLKPDPQGLNMYLLIPLARLADPVIPLARFAVPVLLFDFESGPIGELCGPKGQSGGSSGPIGETCDPIGQNCGPCCHAGQSGGSCGPIDGPCVALLARIVDSAVMLARVSDPVALLTSVAILFVLLARVLNSACRIMWSYLSMYVLHILCIRRALTR